VNTRSSSSQPDIPTPADPLEVAHVWEQHPDLEQEIRQYVRSLNRGMQPALVEEIVCILPERLWRAAVKKKERGELLANNYRSYIFRVARNTSIEFLRAARRDRERLREYAASQPPPAGGTSASEEAVELLRLAEQILAPDQYDLLRMMYGYGRSAESIAKSTGVHPSTVRRHVGDALELVSVSVRTRVSEKSASLGAVPMK